MSSIVFDKERSNDVILVLAEFFPVLAEFFLYWPTFPVLAEFVPYWPSLSSV